MLPYRYTKQHDVGHIRGTNTSESFPPFAASPVGQRTRYCFGRTAVRVILVVDDTGTGDVVRLDDSVLATVEHDLLRSWIVENLIPSDTSQARRFED